MKRNYSRTIISYILPMLLLMFFFTMFSNPQPQAEEITLNRVYELIQDEQISDMKLTGENLTGTLKDENHTAFEATIPESVQGDFMTNWVDGAVKRGELTFLFEKTPETPWYLTMLPDLLFLGIMLFFLYSMMRRQQGQNSSMNNFGKSKARLNKDTGKTIKFGDVAGLKEEKEELSEIVEFLKNPRKFTDMGARIPKGVLLVGPPGTGKTYLSKAVAGEAGVPFYSISGSDFVEMFVGVGASRVRDLFGEGKKNAPCIIFIDEIDAVGRRRGAGLGGGNDEREQTLNQLLVEMDGFDINEGIIIMAATNRPDILDPALLRPGRFDRQVYIGMPDVKEREAILRVHLRNKHIAEDVNLSDIAKFTAGFTPADLENVTNEAALLSARKNAREITQDIFQEAAIKVVAGPEKKSRTVIERERKLTAYHEAGHAIVTKAIPGTDTVNLITIVPRGRAGGFTSFLPDEERTFMSRNEMNNHLISFLGGRAAEALVLDDISTGASNDIERATKLARSMVVKYGMSKNLGPIAYGEEEGDDVFIGKDFGRVRTYSEQTAERIDAEVETLMSSAYNNAKKILQENMELLHKLATELLEKETLRKEDFEKLFSEYGIVNKNELIESY